MEKEPLTQFIIRAHEKEQIISATQRDSLLKLIEPRPLEFPAPPEGESWHNPENLTAEQVEVDKGWRLLTTGERSSASDDRLHFSGSDRQAWVKLSGRWDVGGNCGNGELVTYRTRRPLPQPKKRVPLENADWVQGGPWWVRLKRLPSTPESQWLSLCLVEAISSDGRVRFAQAAGFDQAMNFAEAMEKLERTNDGVNFAPCSKEAV